MSSESPVNLPEPLASVHGTTCLCLYPDFCIHECEGGVVGRAQSLSLLREAYLVRQFSVAGVEAQGINHRVNLKGT